MSAAFECRQRGFSLAWASRQLGEKPDGRPACGIDTLKAWYKDKPIIFRAALEFAEREWQKQNGLCSICSGAKKVPSLIHGKIIDCPGCVGGIINEIR